MFKLIDKKIITFLCSKAITGHMDYVFPYFRYIREAGGVCIADEVQTALGRTGDKLWGFQSQGKQILYCIPTIRYIWEAGGVCIADEVQTALGRTGDQLRGFQSQGKQLFY